MRAIQQLSRQDGVHCKSLQGFMGLLQGNGSTGIPHLQGFTWYEITSNCYCHFAKNTQGMLVICII